MISRYTFDAFVLGASGLDIGTGVTEWNIDDAAVKQTAVAASREVLVAADSTKFGQVAFAKVCVVASVHMIVSDRALSGDDVKAYEDQGVRVELT